MQYVTEGEKVRMIVEQIPLIEVSTGRIISWKVVSCFQVNAPKKKKQEQEKLEVKRKGISKL